MRLEKGTFSIFPVAMCKGLHPYEQLIFIWLCHHTNESGFCFPSLNTLADECGISKDTVSKYIKKLEFRGYLKKTTRIKENKEHVSNLYEIILSNESNNEVSDSVGHVSAENGYPLSAENGYVAVETVTNYINITKPTIELNNIPQSSIANKKKKAVVIDYSPDFETAWSYYPKRQGSNSKVAAWKHWKSRVNEGVSADDLITATRNYQLLLTNNGNIGTAYVMQAQRFYGANKEYEQFINIKQEDLSNEQQPDRKQTAREHHATICNIVNQLCEEAAKITGTV